jgi:hypothetical protein
MSKEFYEIDLGWEKILAWLYFTFYLLDFQRTFFFSVHLKHSSFWPSADVKHMSNDLAHLM